MASRKVKTTLLVAVISAIVCCVLGRNLFSSYYDMTWGASAFIMHSPPHGVYYPRRMLQVGVASGVLGFVIGWLTAWHWQRKRP